MNARRTVRHRWTDYAELLRRLREAATSGDATTGVRIIERPDGTWGVVIMVDGGYAPEPKAFQDESRRFWRDELRALVEAIDTSWPEADA